MRYKWTIFNIFLFSINTGFMIVEPINMFFMAILYGLGLIYIGYILENRSRG